MTAAAVGPDGRYRLGATLGHGGSANVYRAHDTLLDRDVAVKLLHDVSVPSASTGTAEGHDTSRARFITEAKTLASLEHPHLVGILDAGLDSNQPFLVMQLIEGATLAAAIATTPHGLDATTVADVGAQIADALAYTHEHDLVHRDVKPANILLSRTDHNVSAALADFGIARLVNTDDATRHTATGLTVGTAAYLAPEQVRGRAVGTPADVYALGLVLLEAITGTRTFSGTPYEAAVARLRTTPSIPEHLPHDVRDLLRNMTAVDPIERPTAAAVAERLAQWQAQCSAPPSAEPIRRATRVWPHVTRKTAALASGVAALLALGLAAFLLGTDSDPGSPRPGATNPSTPTPGTTTATASTR